MMVVDVGKMKTPTRGRGRGRKKVEQARPGPSDQKQSVVNDQGNNRPGKSVTMSPDLDKTDSSNDVSHVTTTESRRPCDISTSWYDDDEEDEDKSLAADTKEHSSSDTSTDEDDDSSDHDDEEMGQRDGPPHYKNDKMPAVPITRNASRGKGRKRTSTREAPIDYHHKTPINGKSTAPANKKPKVDNKYGKGKKNSYAEASGKEPWTTSDGKKNKRMGKSPFKKMPELKSAAEAALKEIYIQELDCSNCNGQRDFEGMVMRYCKKRGLDAVDACTIPVKNSRTKSGCKLTVQSSDYDAAMDSDFWPRGASVRPWTQRPKGGMNGHDEGSYSE